MLSLLSSLESVEIAVVAFLSVMAVSSVMAVMSVIGYCGCYVCYGSYVWYGWGRLNLRWALSVDLRPVVCSWLFPSQAGLVLSMRFARHSSQVSTGGITSIKCSDFAIRRSSAFQAPLQLVGAHAPLWNECLLLRI